MAKKMQSSPSADPSTLISLNRCIAEGCSRKSERDTFCGEHFEWFKSGLITKKGTKAKDFDKKYRHFRMRKAA